MTRTRADALRWVALGTARLLDDVASLGDGAWDHEVLPGWTRRHLVAHLASNADALGNLVHWASTGVPTPMYATPAERERGIERGPTMTPAALGAALSASTDRLDAGLAALDDEQWTREVVTAQGRTVAATEIPWLRAREVCVHAVDLAHGTTFADLPADFLRALVADVRARRGDVPEVDGPLPEVAAWLTGRAHRLLGAPVLGPWL